MLRENRKFLANCACSFRLSQKGQNTPGLFNIYIVYYYNILSTSMLRTYKDFLFVFFGYILQNVSYKNVKVEIINMSRIIQILPNPIKHTYQKFWCDILVLSKIAILEGVFGFGSKGNVSS